MVNTSRSIYSTAQNNSRFFSIVIQLAQVKTSFRFVISNWASEKPAIDLLVLVPFYMIPVHKWGFSICLANLLISPKHEKKRKNYFSIKQKQDAIINIRATLSLWHNVNTYISFWNLCKSFFLLKTISVFFFLHHHIILYFLQLENMSYNVHNTHTHLSSPYICTTRIVHIVCDFRQYFIMHKQIWFFLWGI